MVLPESKDAEFARSLQEASERGLLFGHDGDEILVVVKVVRFLVCDHSVVVVVMPVSHACQVMSMGLGIFSQFRLLNYKSI